MISTSTVDLVRLIDVKELAQITTLSRATIWRHREEGLLPCGVKIGRSVRWRLRTGDPKTGILDWIEASCPRCQGLSTGLAHVLRALGLGLNGFGELGW